MPENLTTLIARVQALLLDNGTLFSTATVTAAVRRALREVNQTAPNSAAAFLDVEAGRLDYALEPPQFGGLLSVLGVRLEGRPETLAADFTFEGNIPHVHLREAQSAGRLEVRFTVPFTVSGLDGAAQSTLTADQEQVLVEGACAAAILIRLAARVETINLSPEVVEHYKAAMQQYRLAFELGMTLYAARRSQVGEAELRAWNDVWHGWA